nr:MAG TPA: hypothetical protein [Caudoviricetes sp.]
MFYGRQREIRPVRGKQLHEGSGEDSRRVSTCFRQYARGRFRW